MIAGWYLILGIGLGVSGEAYAKIPCEMVGERFVCADPEAGELIYSEGWFALGKAKPPGDKRRCASNCVRSAS